MTVPLPFFGLSGWPGARAGSSAVEVRPGELALAIHLDPMDILLYVPPFPGGERYMVHFLREVADSATSLANQLADHVAATESARHAAREPVASEWFDNGQAGGPDGV